MEPSFAYDLYKEIILSSALVTIVWMSATYASGHRHLKKEVGELKKDVEKLKEELKNVHLVQAKVTQKLGIDLI